MSSFPLEPNKSQLEILAQLSQLSCATGVTAASESEPLNGHETPKKDPDKPGKLEKSIIKNVGRAIGDFDLIQQGDRILVAVSGGKDSWVMLYALEELRKRAPVKFELVAINIDQGYRGFRQDLIEDYVESQGYEYAMAEFNIAKIVADKTKPNEVPCSLCSRLRRGFLSGLAEKHNCNKIALGHHLDDLVETFLLNIFYVGKIATMAPKLQTDVQKVTVIRPLLYCKEEDIRKFALQKKMPIVCCQCPLACGNNEQFDSKRMFVKKMLRVLEQKIPDIRQSLLTSLGNVKSSHLLDKEFLTMAKASLQDSLELPI